MAYEGFEDAVERTPSCLPPWLLAKRKQEGDVFHDIGPKRKVDQVERVAKESLAVSLRFAATTHDCSI